MCPRTTAMWVLVIILISVTILQNYSNRVIGTNLESNIFPAHNYHETWLIWFRTLHSLQYLHQRQTWDRCAPLTPTPCVERVVWWMHCITVRFDNKWSFLSRAIVCVSLSDADFRCEMKVAVQVCNLPMYVHPSILSTVFAYVFVFLICYRQLSSKRT
jgi:hypothetical protein